MILAVDPGDRHTGVACWHLNSVSALEGDSDEVLGQLEEMMPKTDRLVIEEFRLYRHRAGSQIGSDFPTPQMIGALKWIAGQAGVPVTEQGATIKKPMRAQLRARKIKQVGKGGHARDAELHLWFYLLKEKICATD